jgi:hypothetical protein
MIVAGGNCTVTAPSGLSIDVSSVTVAEKAIATKKAIAKGISLINKSSFYAANKREPEPLSLLNGQLAQRILAIRKKTSAIPSPHVVGTNLPRPGLSSR